MKTIKMSVLFVLVLMVSGAFAEQLGEVDSLKQKLRITTEGETVDLLNQLAEAHAGTEWEKSKRYADLALDLATSLDDKYGSAVANINLALYYNKAQDYREALDHAAVALNQFEQVSDDWQIARTLRTIGTTYSLLSQSDQSLDYFLRSLMIFEDIRSEDEIAENVMSLGNIYSQWGQAEKALRFYERALAIYKSKFDYEKMMISGNLLSQSLMALDRFDEAKQQLEATMAIADEHLSLRLRAQTFSNLGELYYLQGEYTDARKYFLDALELKELQGDQGDLALAMSDVARVYQEAGDTPNAIKYFTQGQLMAEEAGEMTISAEIWLQMGELYMQLGNQRKTTQAMLNGLNSATQVANLSLIQEANYMLTEAYSRFGQADKALKYQKAYQETSDEINRQQSSQRVAELEIRYDLDKMDRELNELKGAAVIKEIEYKRRFTVMLVAGAFAAALMILVLGFIFYRSSLIRRAEKEKLEQSLRLKADFTAMLVHDLRSPLTSVFGFAELLKIGEKPQEQIRDIAKTIRQASQKMLTLVNEMLDLSKFEAGKMVLSKTDITLKPIINTSIQMLEPTAGRKDMTITFEANDGLPTCYCDALKVEQVVTNFISNAISHVPKGSLIDVRLEEIEKKGASYLHFSVADNGPGVAKDQQHNIFDKYAQLDARDSGKSSGTGLGLAVSQMIIEQHGGEIGYRDREPKGSIFYFDLPCDDPDRA